MADEYCIDLIYQPDMYATSEDQADADEAHAETNTVEADAGEPEAQ